MKIYWSYKSYKSIPELTNLKPEVARQFWNNGCYQASLHWQVRGSLLLGAVIAGLFGVIGVTLQDKFDFDSMIGLKHFSVAISTGVGALIGGLIYTQTMVSHARSHIREYIQTHKEG
ncbi:MAG: hypothetical protein IPP66_03425 [Anaerolineales bacterium]|nr:hypothetical protein [Anaerolineales bacterium]